MPPTIYVNREQSEEDRRASIYAGDFHLFTGIKASLAIVGWARELIESAFAGHNPEHAQYNLSVEEFVERVGPLKTLFTNSEKTKELCRDYIVELGADPEETYFDLPRLRVAPSDNYLKSGVSYAYSAHRDSWYAQPALVVNTWTPVFDVTGENVMSFLPGYWDKAVLNTGFDYEQWKTDYRPAAAGQIGEENRPHPLPAEPIDLASEIRIALNAGDVTMFSTCHLHATADNTSGKTRFSFDLRTINLPDLKKGAGPRDMDQLASGSTAPDYIRVSDFKPLEVSALEGLSLGR
jgi:Phytanoyl-CoA dioxygenase (PhyH)